MTDRDDIVQPDLLDPLERRANKLPEEKDVPAPVIIELNAGHSETAAGARDRFLRLYEEEIDRIDPRRQRPRQLTHLYLRCYLTAPEMQRLIHQDRHAPSVERRSIQYVWMDYLVRRLIDRSASTIKADAARFIYAAEGEGIVWAVLDSGIDAKHEHFKTYGTLSGEVAELHRDFTALWDEPPPSDLVSSALIDLAGHGTHVAGIIAGALCRGSADRQVIRHRTAEHVSVAATLNAGIGPLVETVRTHEREVEEFTEIEEVDIRTVDDASRLSGIAPRCKLVSLKVLDDAGEGRTSTVIMALRFIAEVANGAHSPRIHGANLSLGYSYNAKAFACGQSPLCCEVNRLVRSGVVVVTAAGNSGYGEVAARTGRSDAALALTINDPGNAALAITVGSTHREAPHTYGVSFFSSKGPTADGRLKPDLVAPGERITSCATGRMLEDVRAVLDNEAPSAGLSWHYVDSSGTSMAAPHVSGAIAAFLSVHREFIGNPAAVKRIFLETATSLGREPQFQGHGLVDLVRALNAV